MTYRIARNGTIHGPYSVAEVQRYLASGNILPSDLAQGETMDEWLPVGDLFPAAPVIAPVHPGGLPALFRDPPNLPWWVALLLEILTAGIFFVIWDLVEAAWMRRVERSSIALYFYIAAALLFLVNVPNSVQSVTHALFDGPLVNAPYAFALSLTGWTIRLIARFVFRSELLRHFNAREPIGLRLNWFLTLVFGGLYFQYHFNRINEVKRTLRVSVPGV